MKTHLNKHTLNGPLSFAGGQGREEGEEEKHEEAGLDEIVFAMGEGPDEETRGVEGSW